jgi:hypothetical protein
MALRAIADDQDALVLDQIDVRIAVVINAHRWFLSLLRLVSSVYSLTP